MKFPAFFDEVPKIKLYDPLAHFLQATEDGILQFSYADIVKVAGHSCATVAGAYLATAKALAFLYPNEELPVRGEMLVEIADAEDQGVAGVIARVVSTITGAAGAGGFKGLQGRYHRKDLLRFHVGDVKGLFRITRKDTGTSADMLYTPAVAPDPKMQAALQAILTNKADKADIRIFKDLWQGRVKKILIDHYDDPRQIQIL